MQDQIINIAHRDLRDLLETIALCRVRRNVSNQNKIGSCTRPRSMCNRLIGRHRRAHRHRRNRSPLGHGPGRRGSIRMEGLEGIVIDTKPSIVSIKVEEAERSPLWRDISHPYRPIKVRGTKELMIRARPPIRPSRTIELMAARLPGWPLFSYCYGPAPIYK